MHLCMCPRIRCSRHRESLPRIPLSSIFQRRRKTKRGRRGPRFQPFDQRRSLSSLYAIRSRFIANHIIPIFIRVRNLLQSFQESEIFFSLRKVIAQFRQKLSDRMYMYKTSWKDDKIPVEFGESRTMSIFEFTAGSGWERRLLFANRWSRTSNICIRMLSVTINGSANMAFTEQNLDIGDLCEINPINSTHVVIYSILTRG